MGLKNSLIGVSGFFGLVNVALGHAGHGHPEIQSGVLHYVVNPSHFAPGLAVCAIIAVSGLFLAARRSHSRARVLSPTGRK